MRSIIYVFVAASLAAAWQSEAAWAQDTESRPPRPIGNIGDWFPQSSMPAESVVRGQVGSVVVRLSVSAEGAVTACSVVKSSGYSLLDAAACDRAKSAGRFEPALDVSGHPVTSTFTLPPLEYVLSKANRSAVIVDDKRKVYNATIRLDVDRSGLIKACRSLNSDMPDTTACADYVVGKSAPAIFHLSGGSTVTISNTIVVDETSDDGLPRAK